MSLVKGWFEFKSLQSSHIQDKAIKRVFVASTVQEILLV